MLPHTHHCFHHQRHYKKHFFIINIIAPPMKSALAVRTFGAKDKHLERQTLGVRAHKHIRSLLTVWRFLLLSSWHIWEFVGKRGARKKEEKFLGRFVWSAGNVWDSSPKLLFFLCLRPRSHFFKTWLGAFQKAAVPWWSAIENAVTQHFAHCSFQ